MSVTERIIVPLDVPTEAAAITLIDQLPQVSFWKVIRAICQQWTWDSTDPQSKQKRIFLEVSRHPQHCWCHASSRR